MPKRPQQVVLYLLAGLLLEYTICHNYYVSLGWFISFGGRLSRDFRSTTLIKIHHTGTHTINCTYTKLPVKKGRVANSIQLRILCEPARAQHTYLTSGFLKRKKMYQQSWYVACIFAGQRLRFRRWNGAQFRVKGMEYYRVSFLIGRR